MNNQTIIAYPFAKVGLPAPALSNFCSSKTWIRSRKGLAGRLSRQMALFFFWPFDFTFVCPTEIRLQRQLRAIQRARLRIVGASVDSVYTHRAWIETPVDQNGIGAIQFPIVSDFTKETAHAYGILDDESGAAHRGLFIMDPEGVLRYQVVTDMNVGRSVEETLRVLQALQSGGLCPVNWKPGDKTL